MIVRYALTIIAATTAGIGCGNTVRHLPGGYDTTPMATLPFDTDTSHRRLAVAVNRSGGYHPDESSTAGEISYSIGKDRSWNRTSLKAFAYGGAYEFDSLVFGLGEREAFYGAGLLATGDLTLRLGSVISIGLGGTYGFLFEFGPYTGAFPEASDIHVWPVVVAHEYITARIGSSTQIDLHIGVGIPGFAFYEIAFFHHRWGLNLGAGAGLGIGGEEPGSGRITAGLSYGL